MQALEFDPTCPECTTRLVDAGDELVCPSCGRTEEKEAAQTVAELPVVPGIASKNTLGSFMGSKAITSDERHTRGINGVASNYEYLKVISDFAGRNEGSSEACARLIDRMGEKLYLPRVVRLEASSIARKVLEAPHPRRRVTVAAVSAYALIAACKLEGTTSVSIREIIDAHAALGRQVTSSSIIQITLESPVKTYARSAEDYIARVLARLSMNQRLQRHLAENRVQHAAFANALRATATDLLKLIGSEKLAGRRPSALAGSAVYSAELVLSRCEARKRRFTQREVAECGDTAEYTVREQCASLFAPAVEDLVSQRKWTLLLQGAG